MLQLRNARTDEVTPVTLARAGALRLHVCKANLRSLLVADLVRRASTLSHDLVVRLTATGTVADADALNIHPAQIVPPHVMDDETETAEIEADVRIGCTSGGGVLVEVGEANVAAVGRGRDPLATRLALLAVDYRKPLDLDDAALDEAAATLARWRGLVAHWAQSPGAPMAPDVVRAIGAAFDNDLDTSVALQALSGLETTDSVPTGAKFETFAYADRFFGLDLARDIR